MATDPEHQEAPKGKVVFTDFHRPALPSGDYDIHISQSLLAVARVADKDEKPAPPGINTNLEPMIQAFSVFGPRFEFAPNLTASQFPPQGSLGAHYNVLPHISFTRSSLPWERFANLEPTPDEAADTSGEVSDRLLKTPWLALLLFDEDELPKEDAKEDAPLDPTRISPVKTLTLDQHAPDARWTLKPAAPAEICPPEFRFEHGQKPGDKLSVIDVPRDLLAQIMPSPREAALLAHVRHAEADFGPIEGSEVATLVCNRLPRKGKKSVLHIVSLEAEYGPDEATLWNVPDGAEHVRLVTLGSWNFTCLNPRHSFKGLLHHLNKEHLFSVKSPPVSEGQPDQVSDGLQKGFLDHGTPLPETALITAEHQGWLIDDFDNHRRVFLRVSQDGQVQAFVNQDLVFELPSEFDWKTANEDGLLTATRAASQDPASLVKISDTCQINAQPTTRWRIFPTNAEGHAYWVHANDDVYDVHAALPHVLARPSQHLDVAKARVDQGHIAVAHEIRDGDRSIAWYRGPLVPGAVTAPFGPPQTPRSGDQLSRYNATEAMYSESYSTAWELGRMLTLQNQKVAVSLFNWKRQNRHNKERALAMAELGHLPIQGQAHAALPDQTAGLPADVDDWFADLALLKGVPFNYLVPDPEMLPQEALRFFQVDPYWVRCLHDGAFSIGRVQPLDLTHEHEAQAASRTRADSIISGMLLRSELVSGWPDLQIDAYDRAIPHESYETALQPPRDGVRSHPSSSAALSAALSANDGPAVAQQFGIDPAQHVDFFPHEDGGWRININHNKQIFRLTQNNQRYRLWLEDRLAILRMTRLSPNVLLCLFAGDLKSLDIHQKPQALHFGFSQDPDSNTDDISQNFRELKSHIGTEIAHSKVAMPAGTSHERDARRTIPIAALADNMQAHFANIDDDYLRRIAIDAVGEDAEAALHFETAFRSNGEQPFQAAQTALQLTEGVQKLRFVVSELARIPDTSER